MRVLLKLSGESLKGDKPFGVSSKSLENICKVIKEVKEKGHEIGIVTGAGNFFRGRDGQNITRTTADDMGMLATVMNSIALSDAFENIGVGAEVYSNIAMPKICQMFNAKNAKKSLSDGKVVIFAGGSGNPFFSTDTAAALKCLEIEADMFLLGKNIDGVYDKDPNKYEDATKYTSLTFLDVIEKDLKVMDQTAITLCRENNVPIYVFDMMKDPNNLVRVIEGENIGTIVKD